MHTFTKVGLDALLTPENCAVLLIDHQPSQLANVNSHEPTMVINNVTALAKTPKAYGVPTILTTINAKRGGEIFKQVLAVFPDQKPIDRTFINSWEDRRVVEAVKSTGRKKLVIAALWSEMCLVQPAIHRPTLVSARSRSKPPGPGRMHDVRQAIGQGVRHHGDGRECGPRGRLGIRSRGCVGRVVTVLSTACELSIGRNRSGQRFGIPGPGVYPHTGCIGIRRCLYPDRHPTPLFSRPRSAFLTFAGHGIVARWLLYRAVNESTVSLGRIVTLVAGVVEWRRWQPKAVPGSCRGVEDEVSQQAVEQTLGRLLTDAAFRRCFFADPSRAVVLSGLTLSSVELDALRRLPAGELATLGRHLDDRICRLCCAGDEDDEHRGL